MRTKVHLASPELSHNSTADLPPHLLEKQWKLPSGLGQKKARTTHDGQGQILLTFTLRGLPVQLLYEAGHSPPVHRPLVWERLSLSNSSHLRLTQV